MNKQKLREQVANIIFTNHVDTDDVSYSTCRDTSDEIITLIRNETLDEAYKNVKKACKHPHENVAGCIFTNGTQKQHELDLQAINNLRDYNG